MQGLQDKIKIVAIDLADRPTWYKEKVYPENKVRLVNLFLLNIFMYKHSKFFFSFSSSFAFTFIFSVGAFPRAQQPGERRELGFG
jgi:hypothetical protein